MTDLPFRWDVARRERLGSLLEGPVADDYPGFFDDLRACCVRVAAAATDGDMVFVGRSPESIFDYLSGALGDTSWAERPVLVNFSMRHETADEIARKDIHALRAMRAQLATLGLAPYAIAASERPRVFIDLVYAGETFGRLLGLLEHWAKDAGVDPAAVRRRIRFLGITERTKNSPNTWRWYQKKAWAARMPRRSLRGVSIPYRLWTYLGDLQEKVSRWNPPMVWGHEALTEPPRETLRALRLAYALHQRARDPAERARFATGLAAQRELRDPAVRKLVLELRGG